MYFQLVPSTHRTDEIEFGLLPTPTTQEPSTPCEITETGRRMTKDGKGSHSLNLGRLAGMIPTPTASDWKGGTIRKGDYEKFQDTMLQHYIRASVEQDSKTSQLNPRFVGEMMGFPPNWTESPFLSGDKNP
jgi:hypothetical protein